MDLKSIVGAGLPGIVLGVVCTLLTGLGGYFISAVYNKGKRTAVSAAIGTTAGNAVGTPAVLALADSNLLPYVEVSTAQIAAAIIVTAILCPLLVSILSKREKRHYEKQE